MSKPKFEEYILGDTTKSNFFYSKGNDQSEINNILLQAFINNQGVRNNQFFPDKHVLEDKHQISAKGFTHYWNNDLTNDFSIRQIDDNNTKALKEIIKYHGFPKFENLEDITMKAVFVIMFYSNDKELLTENIQPFKDNLVSKGFPSKYYAYLVDKLDFLDNRPQTYGTCFVVDDDYNKPTIKILDDKNLDKRRLEIGLDKYEEWKKTLEFKELGERKTMRDLWSKTD